MGFFKWICQRGKPVEITLIRKQFGWPDAGGDKCMVCGVIRRDHGGDRGHRFEEVVK